MLNQNYRLIIKEGNNRYLTKCFWNIQYTSLVCLIALEIMTLIIETMRLKHFFYRLNVE